jgi:hypothetical protein
MNVLHHTPTRKLQQIKYCTQLDRRNMTVQNVESCFVYCYNYDSRVELLVSLRVPPQVADRGMFTRYGGYWGNKIPGADQNQHHCLVTKGDLQRLGKETQQKISLLRGLDGSPITEIGYCELITCMP